MECSLWRRLSVVVMIIISTTTVLPVSLQEEVLDHFCGQYASDGGGRNLTFTAGSAFSSNLDRLRSTLNSSSPSPSGFYNVSEGQNPDEVHSIVLCRGDFDNTTCRSCIINATAVLGISLCPNNKEAFIWYDSCMFRYSNRVIIGTAEADPLFWGYNDRQNVSNSSLESFNRELNGLMGRLRRTAAGGGPVKKFATDSVPFGNFLNIYGLAQCTPDLSESECSACLSRYIGIIPTCCERRAGGKVVGPTCNLRYEYQAQAFYRPTPSSSSLPPSPPPLVVEPPPDGKNSFIVVVVAVAVAIVFLAVAAIILLRRRRNTKKREIQDNLEAESLRVEFNKIREATDDFSEDNKLGQGGFGQVYKGRYRDGQEIAVKRLSKNSSQGRNEFANEVLLLAKLQHRNLVRLLGFASHRDERLLIYEFLPQSSLDKYIDPTNSHLLDWETRYKIVTGIARGTQYLHEDSQLRIIHRDLKPSNILLDMDLNPKIADFGMALLFPGDITHASASKVVGTLGYIAPEYVMKNQVSVKADVYSFGVLVLEIISGQQLRHFGGEGEHLLSSAWENWRKGLALNLMDPSLRSGVPELGNEVVRCIHLALLCVQENPVQRPSMATILQMLSSDTITMPQPSRPAFFAHSTTVTPDGSQTDHHTLLKPHNEEIQCTDNEATISVLSPR